MICDFAETYKIYDYKEFPASYIAVLAKGLSPDSRIKRSFVGVDVSDDYLLKSLIYDRLNLLLWIQSEDGAKGRNKPVSLYESLTDKTKRNKDEGFESSEDFDVKRKELLNSLKKGGKVIG